MSTILSAEDLNDFIAPGVACVKPVQVEKSREHAEIAIGLDGRPEEEGQALAPAQISLQDCLACSGCITSSEAMLVELQSPKELFSQLEKRGAEGGRQVFVASVSHQARVSFAKAYGLPLDYVDAKLRGLFVAKLGFHCVLGTEVGRALSLEESWREVADARARHQQSRLAGGGAGAGGVVLSSVCPGWTLYAEKTHPEILSHLSTVRSPQQITGHLAKRLLSAELGVAPAAIYHVAVMPCFDKKLESARPGAELGDDGREVDLVITAREIVDMLENSMSTSFAELPSVSEPGCADPATNGATPGAGNGAAGAMAAAQAYPRGWPVADHLKSNAGSSSGGYLDYILHRAQLLSPGSTVAQVPGKNSDYVEYQLLDARGEPLLRGAQVYGFRNIQNLVRKLKMKRAGKAKVKPRRAAGGAPGARGASGALAATLSEATELDYVELMACPGGCVNGGGQIGAPESIPSKLWIQELNGVYNQLSQLDVTPDLVARYERDLGTGPARDWLHTQYKPVVKDESLPAALTLGTQW